MKYTIKFGTYLGIPVRIHFTFPLILLAFGLDAWIRGGWQDALWVVFLVIAVFVCVVLHEFGHSLQVRRYGIDVRDIILLPIGGMARADKIPDRPRHEILVAISGPLVNFALAAVLLGIFLVRRTPPDYERDFIFNLLSINIILGTFNLIPAFPMDGGRILRGFLATRMSYMRATRYAKNVGQIIAIVFVLVGFYDTTFIMLPVIAVFVFFGAISEERMVRVRVGLQGLKIGELLSGGVHCLRADETIESAGRRLGGNGPPALPVADAGGIITGAVERDSVLAALRAGRGGEPLGTIMTPGFRLVDGDTPAIQVFYLLRSEKQSLVGVVESGRYKGHVLYDDLLKRLP